MRRTIRFLCFITEFVDPPIRFCCSDSYLRRQTTKDRLQALKETGMCPDVVNKDSYIHLMPPHPLYSKEHRRRWQAEGVKAWARITMTRKTQDRLDPPRGSITWLASKMSWVPDERRPRRWFAARETSSLGRIHTR